MSRLAEIEALSARIRKRGNRWWAQATMPEISAAIVDLIAMVKDEQQRYATAEKMAQRTSARRDEADGELIQRIAALERENAELRASMSPAEPPE